MFTTMTVQLSTPTLLRLIEYLRMRSGSKDVSEALNTALEFWLDAREPVQKSDFDPDWDLPERRKFRYRMEDIAY